MFVSVIIPTRHRNDALAECLRLLAPGRQTLAAENYEVIVTDDGAVTTAEVLVRESFPWAHWTQEPRRGPAANRNHGAAQARGEWLAFTDDDCLPSAEWLASYAAAAGEQPAARVLEGRTCVDRPRQSCFEHSPINETGGYLWSCNFAMVRELFIAMNGFDERFVHAAMEDVELRTRLQKAGVTPVFCRAASVLHPWRINRQIRRHKADHLKSVLLFNSLHPDQAMDWRRELRFMARQYTCGVWRDLHQFGWEAVSYYARTLGPDLFRLRQLAAQKSTREKSARFAP